MARPTFKPTADQRERVMLTSYIGMAKIDIAAALGIDPDTLNKHFARELLHGPEIIRQQILAAVTAEAIKGKKAAIALLERMTRSDRLRQRPG